MDVLLNTLPCVHVFRLYCAKGFVNWDTEGFDLASSPTTEIVLGRAGGGTELVDFPATTDWVGVLDPPEGVVVPGALTFVYIQV
ncbi:hypothetical protein HO173_008251 [Letharia columbiana]|uniref:Uncharacterized protein n=1 Tax=Letharia columbiana TaxID=112416 RepID=A0A8H6L2V6_9LECA|nr:uncharacterized protein HO173_008251 [Letharia columbiana]KAF6233520.1 hypothetical protein HO173_008251 [Letharia columbiana]